MVMAIWPFSSQKIFYNNEHSLHCCLLKVLYVGIAVLLPHGFLPSHAQLQDFNDIVDPCVQLGRLKRKDGITLALAMAGPISTWYNSSDLNLNVLSPCSTHLEHKISSHARVAVFRPVIEQIAVMRINNASYLELTQNFHGNASLIVYAGRNPTIVSTPRYFLVPYGRIPELTLVLNFQLGKLAYLMWKNSSCEECGLDSAACIEGACATPESSCTNVDYSNSTAVNGTDPCRLTINVAFSGTDRYSQLLTTWYQVSHIQSYSLSGLYLQSKSGIIQGLQDLDRDTGG